MLVVVTCSGVSCSCCEDYFMHAFVEVMPGQVRHAVTRTRCLPGGDSFWKAKSQALVCFLTLLLQPVDFHNQILVRLILFHMLHVTANEYQGYLGH
jgi:hypothetical protein